MRAARLTERRSEFDAADIEALVADDRFLVAVDAYGANCCSLAQMLQLAATGPPYIPRDLHPMTFSELVMVVVSRIHSGELIVREEAKQKFRSFYDVQVQDYD